MRLTKLTVILFVCITSISTVIAQDKTKATNWCVTDQEAENKKLQNPSLIEQEEIHKQQVRDYIENLQSEETNPESSPYIIPVVFHCITDGNQNYVSKSDVEDLMLTLNEDFQRMNADTGQTRSIFQPVAMNMDIQFRLAQIDPNGNCTDGIVRLDSPLSTSCQPRDAVKAVSYWPSNQYFNVWVVNNINASGSGLGAIAGYAHFPWWGINANYGVVIDGTFVNRNDRTFTHEVGHCFGLLHTFQSGCGSNCTNSGDDVCDTPPSSFSTQGCNPTQDQCINDHSGTSVWGGSGVVYDQVENYMSYDQCQNMFTEGQKARMEFYLNGTLNSLNTPTNRLATGVADPYLPSDCAPVTDFNFATELDSMKPIQQDPVLICEGDSVEFEDFSWNTTPTIWDWTFVGGTPNVSSLPTPVITYNTPGVYDVSYQTTSGGGSGNLETKVGVITVSSLTADYIGPVIDGFENSTQFTTDWIVQNESGSGQGWMRNTNAAATGSASVRIRNSQNNTENWLSLISPSYDLSTSSPSGLKFKLSYAKKTNSDVDLLYVKYSLDCGKTWVTPMVFTSGTMATAPNTSTDFVPNSTQWVEHTLNLAAIDNETNVRFKFEFKSNGGNNIYLDDINLGDFGTVGVDEFSSIANFSIYPNPTNSSAKIAFNLIENVNNLSIKVKNSIGQEVTNVINGQSFNVGKYTLKIDEERRLSPGLYFVEFNADNNIKVEKLIVQ